jgi:hypothetical protein
LATKVKIEKNTRGAVMGFYVNPGNESKETFLQREGIVAPLLPKITWASVPKGFLPVTLINNGAFTAAGIAYCERELDTFTRLTDDRPRQLFMVKIEKLIPVADSDFKQYAMKQGWIPTPPKRTTKERLTLEMTFDDAVKAMAEVEECPGVSNFNAEMICRDILMYGKSIDLDDAFQGFGSILALDSLGIWGDDILSLHILCGRSIVKMIAVLRANQLGGLAGITREKLVSAIANPGEEIDLDAVMLAVKKRLPHFNTEFRMPSKHDNGSVVLV